MRDSICDSLGCYWYLSLYGVYLFIHSFVPCGSSNRLHIYRWCVFGVCVTRSSIWVTLISDLITYYSNLVSNKLLFYTLLWGAPLILMQTFQSLWFVNPRPLRFKEGSASQVYIMAYINLLQFKKKLYGKYFKRWRLYSLLLFNKKRGKKIQGYGYVFFYSFLERNNGSFVYKWGILFYIGTKCQPLALKICIIFFDKKNIISCLIYKKNI